VSETTAERVLIRFPGNARYLPAIRALVREMLTDEAGAPAIEGVPKILLAVQEACVNAIRHGHGGDPSLPVELTVVNGPDRVELRVRDGGDGFRLPEDEPFTEDLTAESGRGLAIIQTVMDEVSVDQDADSTVLSLVKRKGEA